MPFITSTNSGRSRKFALPGSRSTAPSPARAPGNRQQNQMRGGTAAGLRRQYLLGHRRAARQKRPHIGAKLGAGDDNHAKRQPKQPDPHRNMASAQRLVSSLMRISEWLASPFSVSISLIRLPAPRIAIQATKCFRPENLSAAEQVASRQRNPTATAHTGFPAPADPRQGFRECPLPARRFRDPGLQRKPMRLVPRTACQRDLILAADTKFFLHRQAIAVVLRI